MKVLITGANGFIGKALCNKIAREGHDIIAVIKPGDNDCFNNNSRVKTLYRDISEFGSIDEEISDGDIDVVYHFAWIGSAGPLRRSYEVQISNVQYAIEFLYACSRLGCKKFIFAASIMEYEIEAIMNSDRIPGINTLYSTAKLAADYMMKAVASDIGITYIRALISNVYGPGEVSERLVNSSIRKMLKGERCSFSSGEQLYDFIYIDDAVEAFSSLGKMGMEKTYYIGSLRPEPLKNFLIKIRDTVNRDLDIGIGDVRFEGVSLKYNEFDVWALKNDTGFVPQINFEEGIRRTAEWIEGGEEDE